MKFSETLAVIAVYVDDLILLTQAADDMRDINRLLETQFRMKDMGDLHNCLGIGVKYDKKKHLLWLHQKQYILNILEKLECLKQSLSQHHQILMSS